ncbi:MAG: DUF2975 domain-containing protein [Pseudomonadota bacterium]
MSIGIPMIRYFAHCIAWGCTFALIALPLAALYFLFDIAQFTELAIRNLGLPVQWHTVMDLQWYALWLATAIYLSLGLIGLYFLRRAFFNFARGELFSLNNSRDLRMFSIFLFAQAVAKPVHLSLASILLTMNHPAGERMLSISFGSDQITLTALAMIMWVLSDLLVKASQLEQENRQFV